MSDAIIAALDDLTLRRYGTADFLVGADGHLIHIETVFTEKLGGMDPKAFFEGLLASGKLQKGDRVQIPANDGKYDYVRIFRPAKEQ